MLVPLAETYAFLMHKIHVFCCLDASGHTTVSSSLLSQIRGLLIDAEDENVGLSQDLLEGTHEDLNSLEDLVKRCIKSE